MATVKLFSLLFLVSVFTWCRSDKLDLILGKHNTYCGISSISFDQKANSTASTNETLVLRIVGGSNAERLEFPWQISLRRWSLKAKRWYHTCGGAIIDNQWILTAAHCTLGQNVSADQFRVRVGEHDYTKIEGDEFDVNVSKILAHPRFNMITIEPDINLIKLEQPINFVNGSKFTPICIAKMELNQNLTSNQLLQKNGTEENNSPKNCFSSGWGKLKLHGEFPTVLQKVPVNLIDQEQCKEAYEGIAEVTDGMMCSGRGGKGTCEGDSGGPLQCLEHVDADNTRQPSEMRWTLHGLTSWAVGCAEEKYPSVAARVSRYRNWIAETINDNSD